MSAQSPTEQLSASGVSIWLDDLSRARIYSGELQTLIATRNVVGITTNPTIFATALAGTEAYDAQIAALGQAGLSVADAIEAITTEDVAKACHIFRDVFDRTDGQDGRVSIEVSPAVAHDAAATVAEAERLKATVDRPNACIKIPATKAGLVAIEEATARGISVNVTLIFSLDRYRGVIEAYFAGLERARDRGIGLHGIRSVASFFVSRVDTEIDRRLEAIGTANARALRGKSGLANARLAYQLFQEQFSTDRAKRLLAAGANLQRPLWASTGVKDPALPDTLYVTELVAADVVNTMPEKTLQALADHGIIRGDSITSGYANARAVIDELAAVGISYDDVTRVLEEEGIAKFTASWSDLSETVEAALHASASAAGHAR